MPPDETASAPPPPGPLRGVRVVDCSTVLAGPYCTMLLADLGADVVKVEPPEGDSTRGWGPPWQVAPPERGTATADRGTATPEPWTAPAERGTVPPERGTAPADRVAAYFLAANRNKRSVRLDLRQAGGRDILRTLIARADVLVENFRAGAFERLGFGDEALRDLNARLVHLAITGYGPAGPLANRPGYDFLVQAQAGLMSITGFPDEEGGQATKVGVAVSDVATGLFGAIGILAALVERGREDGPGHGQRVDVSIFESTLAILVNQAQNLFVSGSAPKRRGNTHPNIVPYETFETSDGQIAIGVGSERQWERFCAVLEDQPLAADERFRTNGERVRHRDELRPLLAARFRAGTTAAWLARLEEGEVPSAPLNDLAAAFVDPQVEARGLLVDLEHPSMGRVRQVAAPIQLSQTPASVRTPPPLLGEHTDEILRELGLDEAAILRLHEEDVV